MESPIINGRTRILGIIGNPVGHSLSPLIHNHLLRRLSLPYVYIPLNVQSDKLHIVLHALRALDFAGANVTIPYKSAVIPYCDSISELSRQTSTVNTLFMHQGLLHGTTTDADGFFKALLNINHEITNGNIVILGNGGTARTLSIACALEKKITSLTLIGRNHTRLQALAEDIQVQTGFHASTALFNAPESRLALEQCSLLVNCTSVGMTPAAAESPLPQEVFHRGMTVFDTIYNPAETLLLRYARTAGCKTINGLRMLIYQGVASFKCWTGIDVDSALLNFEELQQAI